MKTLVNEWKDLGNGAKINGCETGLRKFQKNAITEASVDFVFKFNIFCM